MKERDDVYASVDDLETSLASSSRPLIMADLAEGTMWTNV
jgi:hypothetical protein